MCLTALGGNIVSLVVYQGILRNKKQTALLVAFGVVLPVILWYPFFIADFLDIRSPALRMSILSLPLTCTLRTLHGERTFYLFSLDFLSVYSCLTWTRYLVALIEEKPLISWSQYRREFGFVLHPLRDPKTRAFVPATRNSILSAFLAYFKWLLVIGFAYSILVPSSFVLWSTPRALHETFLSFHPSHLANNFVHAGTLFEFSTHSNMHYYYYRLIFFLVLTSWMLELSVNTGVNGVMQLLSGIQFENVVDNPMFGSQSPSDFWGRRWNRMIHTDLKVRIVSSLFGFVSRRVSTFNFANFCSEWCLQARS